MEIIERRWFVRCIGCLSVMAVSGNRPQPGLRCGVCSGRIEVMGVVHQDRLTKTEDRCACDERCTSASGPSCNCKCGGKNHGSGVVVAVVVDLGGAPKITPQNPEKAKRIYGEWVEAKKAVEDRINWAFNKASKLSSNQSLSTGDFMQITHKRRLMQEVERVEALKSRHSRLQAIEKVNKRISAILRDRSREIK